MVKIEIRRVQVIQYVQPLREGGSLPAIVRADDDFMYVLKFRGAGQGTKALVAELIGGELARAIGLKVPELVFMDLDESLGRNEPDEEIQDLLKFSVGLNLGLHFLSGAITFDPLTSKVDALTASKVVLLDSLIGNIDRTAKNANLLSWHNELWVIDNGASFYFHHNWATWEKHLERTFPFVKEHVLLKQAAQLPRAAQEILGSIDREKIKEIVSTVPEEWLRHKSDPMGPQAMRAAYIKFITTKLSMMDLLVKEAEDAR